MYCKSAKNRGKATKETSINSSKVYCKFTRSNYADNRNDVLIVAKCIVNTAVEEE